jgi:hypothetical protein
MPASLTRCRDKFLSPRRRKEREGNPDSEKEWFIAFDAWIADTRNQSGCCTSQVSPVYFQLFFAFFASLR